MIALPDRRRKWRFGGADRRCKPRTATELPSHNRSQNPYCCPNSAHSRPLCPAIVTPVRWPDPVDPGFLSPQPPGSVGSGLYAANYPLLWPALPAIFFSKLALFRTPSFQKPSAIAQIAAPGHERRQHLISHCHDWRVSSGSGGQRVTGTWSAPRPAWCRDARDCRSARTPPRHRHPRRRDFPAAHSSAPARRASRRA